MRMKKIVSAGAVSGAVMAICAGPVVAGPDGCCGKAPPFPKVVYALPPAPFAIPPTGYVLDPSDAAKPVTVGRSSASERARGRPNSPLGFDHTEFVTHRLPSGAKVGVTTLAQRSAGSAHWCCAPSCSCTICAAATPGHGNGNNVRTRNGLRPERRGGVHKHLRP